MKPRQTYDGADAWRNGFTVNAADLLQCVRWGCQWNDETFKRVLVVVARRTKGTHTNVRTVEKVLAMLSREGFLTTNRESDEVNNA